MQDAYPSIFSIIHSPSEFGWVALVACPHLLGALSADTTSGRKSYAGAEACVARSTGSPCQELGAFILDHRKLGSVRLSLQGAAFALQKRLGKGYTCFTVTDDTGEIEVMVFDEVGNVKAAEGDKLQLTWFKRNVFNSKLQLKSEMHSRIQVGDSGLVHSKGQL